jgi:hypothetical protein
METDTRLVAANEVLSNNLCENTIFYYSITFSYLFHAFVGNEFHYEYKLHNHFFSAGMGKELITPFFVLV